MSESATREQITQVSFNADVPDMGTIQFQGSSEDFRYLLTAISYILTLIALLWYLRK